MTRKRWRSSSGIRKEGGTGLSCSSEWHTEPSVPSRTPSSEPSVSNAVTSNEVEHLKILTRDWTLPTCRRCSKTLADVKIQCLCDPTALLSYTCWLDVKDLEGETYYWNTYMNAVCRVWPIHAPPRTDNLVTVTQSHFLSGGCPRQ